MVAGSGIWRTSCLREARSSAILSFIYIISKLSWPRVSLKEKRKSKNCFALRKSAAAYQDTSAPPHAWGRPLNQHNTRLENHHHTIEGATVIQTPPSGRHLPSQKLCGITLSACATPTRGPGPRRLRRMDRSFLLSSAVKERLHAAPA